MSIGGGNCTQASHGTTTGAPTFQHPELRAGFTSKSIIFSNTVVLLWNLYKSKDSIASRSLCAIVFFEVVWEFCRCYLGGRLGNQLPHEDFVVAMHSRAAAQQVEPRKVMSFQPRISEDSGSARESSLQFDLCFVPWFSVWLAPQLAAGV